ncbi:MAG TPA: type II secretion system protein [Planctomycetota bacterium]|nr:type II secretion system protein [Planctomycetota bacterium]
MKGARGFTLVEFIVCIALLAGVLNLVMSAWVQFSEAHQRVETALEDLSTAGRFLEDLKADLRQARKLTVEAGGIRLRMGDGGEVVYREEGSDGGRVRVAGADLRRYPQSFESVTYRREPGRMVAVELELRKFDAASEFHPRLGATVYCADLE